MHSWEVAASASQSRSHWLQSLYFWSISQGVAKQKPSPLSLKPWNAKQPQHPGFGEEEEESTFLLSKSKKIGVLCGESHSISGLCSFPRYSAPCASPKGALQHWKSVQQLLSFLSLSSTHCSRERPRVTAAPQGLHVSPASMGTLLPVIHTRSPGLPLLVPAVA